MNNSTLTPSQRDNLMNNKGMAMSIDANAGNAILALSASSGVANFLAQADTIVSLIVGVLSAIGIVYSIVWHRVRISQAKKKSDE